VTTPRAERTCATTSLPLRTTRRDEERPVDEPTAETPRLREDRDHRGVVTLTIDRPEVRNAFDAQLMAELTEAATRLADDDSCRAVVLTGAGSVFSAGADLSWMSAMAGYSMEENQADSRRFETMLRLVAELPMPVLARVNGHALGGAAGLLGCVDIAVAARGALFGFTEARIGIVPAMISAYVQPRIGLANARRYFLTGERFDADRAYDLGLVHEVADPDDLDATFARVLDEVLAAGPLAQREVKRLVTAIDATPDPADSLELRIELISRLRVSEEGQEGMRAFFERRPPAWVPTAD
jgi:methylglutaconyl-CoA hydratase